MVPISEQATPADYSLLGLAVGADSTEVKKAYRTLALQNHPDITGGDKEREAKFKRATLAYERIVRAPLAAVAEFAGVAPGTRVWAPQYSAPPAQLSTLSRDDQVWIAADAVHVGLDRNCYIDPVARLHPYETSASAICVDVDAEGYRITFPSSLRTNWVTEDLPIGLVVATVRIVPPSTATKLRAAEYVRMPEQLISTTLKRAPEGDVYVPTDGILVSKSSVTIDLDSPFVTAPSLRAPVRIRQRGTERYVHADGRLSDWLLRRNKLSGNTVVADAAQIGSTTFGSQMNP